MKKKNNVIWSPYLDFSAHISNSPHYVRSVFMGSSRTTHTLTHMN